MYLVLDRPINEFHRMYLSGLGPIIFETFHVYQHLGRVYCIKP